MCPTDFFSWPGWAGVTGLIAVIALIAAIIIGARQIFWAQPDASFTYTEVHLGELDSDGMQHAKAILSACGPATLFELDATLVIHGEKKWRSDQRCHSSASGTPGRSTTSRSSPIG